VIVMAVGAHEPRAAAETAWNVCCASDTGRSWPVVNGARAIAMRPRPQVRQRLATDSKSYGLCNTCPDAPRARDHLRARAGVTQASTSIVGRTSRRKDGPWLGLVDARQRMQKTFPNQYVE
jgi:hypothetical protein